ncbi:MAG: transposase, partial [Spirochaetales bacterium]|nr:transposase [Spirochaetales bacterium]
FQMYQKYISRISEESLQKLLVELNKIAINEGLEDLKKIRQDSTVVETNIHHPTNNSLVWDCIKTSHRLLEKLSEELPETKYYNYIKSAKRTYFKINNTKSKDKQKQLFKKQLIVFTKTINNLSNAVKKKSNCNIKAYALISEIESFIPMCRKVYSQTERFQIQGEKVHNSEKVFSIYESHTDIIVKGAREVEFGHKIDLSGGKSNLILDCDILKGNISDSKLYKPAIERIEKNYGKTPGSTSNDGGYASKANIEFAQEKGIKNIVFNKVVGSLKNIASSKNMATRLKKWRSGIEAVISNLKRGFNLRRVNWKGFEHFKSKVLWSVIAYNIRVMTRHILADLK